MDYMKPIVILCNANSAIIYLIFYYLGMRSMRFCPKWLKAMVTCMLLSIVSCG